MHDSEFSRKDIYKKKVQMTDASKQNTLEGGKNAQTKNTGGSDELKTTHPEGKKTNYDANS